LARRTTCRAQTRDKHIRINNQSNHFDSIYAIISLGKQNQWGQGSMGSDSIDFPFHNTAIEQ
jgi:hypothetical protein